MSLKGFAPFADNLDENNRWVLLGKELPWDELAGIHHRALSADQGRPALDARRVIGAMIIKHMMGLDDRGTVGAIQENPYMQWFCGLSAFSTKAIFDASLMVTLRKRMGTQVYERMDQAILDRVEEQRKQKGGAGPGDPQGLGDQEPPTHKGELKVDATVAPQKIAYPTDLDLLSASRECTEGLIDALSKHLDLERKPRTYRKVARKTYLLVIKKKKRTYNEIRKAIGAPSPKRLWRVGDKQLRYLRRNLRTIDRLWGAQDASWPLAYRQLRAHWIVQQVYAQQMHMHKERTHRVADRIVSVHQPHVRPIVRGKAAANVEFGAKLNVALCDGIAWPDHIGWDAHNESEWPMHHVQCYKQRYGHYPEAVNVGGIYGTRENRRKLQELGIRFIGKARGRPTTESLTPAAKRALANEMAQRNAIEGKFGQGKNAYGLDRIGAKLKATSESWIAAIFLVMNLKALFSKLPLLVDLIRSLLGVAHRQCRIFIVRFLLHSWYATLSANNDKLLQGPLCLRP